VREWTYPFAKESLVGRYVRGEFPLASLLATVNYNALLRRTNGPQMGGPVATPTGRYTRETFANRMTRKELAEAE
jgi:hypothetical protein